MLTEIEKMTTELVTDEELAQAKDGILNSEVFSFDTKREILDRMVMFERYGYEPDFLQQYQANVKAMRFDQVRDGLWKIPLAEYKTRKKIKTVPPVPIIQQAQAILDRRQAAAGDCPWVFPRIA